MKKVSDVELVSEVELRAALIAAARTMVARDGNTKFSLKRLYAESGIGRAGFRRCFAGKADLIAAIVGGDVRALGAMAQVMAPAQVQKVAVGSDVVAAPAADAWLERRLRVFERALAALETRLEKSEQFMQREIGLLGEKIAGPVPHAVVTPIAAPASAPQVETVVEEEPRAKSPLPAQTAFPREEEEPVSEREIEDFLGRARAAAKAAAEAPVPERSLALPRWIAWMGVGLVTLLVCAGLALGNAARATQMVPDGGIAYRAVPPDEKGRLMALADSGDARAQTLLALAYLHGSAQPNDDTAAMRWSNAAAQQGEPVAEYLLGALLSKKDAPRAFSWFQQAALHGNLKAMHNLAIAYAQGEGVNEDDKRAAAWFGRAAAQGYLDFQFDLAVLFERGQGVTQNRIAALKWYLIAATKGDAAAASRAVQLRTQMPSDDAARAVRAATAYMPQPHDQLANAVTSP